MIWLVGGAAGLVVGLLLLRLWPRRDPIETLGRCAHRDWDGR